MRKIVDKSKAAFSAALLYLWPPIHDAVPAEDRWLAGVAGVAGILLGCGIAVLVVLLVVLG